jgi:hypothetical protein
VSSLSRPRSQVSQAQKSSAPDLLLIAPAMLIVTIMGLYIIGEYLPCVLGEQLSC